ncbi:oxygenase MpaB family protein [Gymnodinialimonas sp.]
MSRWSEEIERLDPSTDFERIVFLLGTCEFAWDIEKALEFALFRTYGVPSISGLLARTGAFLDDTRKRYDDTELLLSEISENGQDSARGRAALDRINAMHGHYRISNDDMLYVLTTFVVEPVKWLERFGRRAMKDREREAWTTYHRTLGRRMGIDAIPADYEAFDALGRAYEKAHFRYADSNAEIGIATRDLLLSFYLPKILVPFGRPAVHALCDPPLRAAMGFASPPVWLERLVFAGLGLRAALLRRMPARRRPRLITARKRPTYPAGYRITELGTFPKGTK